MVDFRKFIATCLTQRGHVLLICDEVLGGLDSIRQPRVLRMLKQLQDHLEAKLDGFLLFSYLANG